MARKRDRRPPTPGPTPPAGVPEEDLCEVTKVAPPQAALFGDEGTALEPPPDPPHGGRCRRVWLMRVVVGGQTIRACRACAERLELAAHVLEGAP